MCGERCDPHRLSSAGDTEKRGAGVRGNKEVVDPQVNEVDPTFETWCIIRCCATVGYRRGVRNSFCQKYSETRSSTAHQRWTPPDDALWDLFGSPVKLHQVKSDGYENVDHFRLARWFLEKVGATKCRPQLVDETLGIPYLPRRGFISLFREFHRAVLPSITYLPCD